MTLQAPVRAPYSDEPGPLRGRLTTRWLRRSLGLAVAFWVAVVAVPQVLHWPEPWRAFGAGLVIPGASILYAIPAAHHPFSTTLVVGHAVVILMEVAFAAWALRRFRSIAGGFVVLAIAAVAAGIVFSPTIVVIAGHVAAFIGVLVACGWAFAIRLISNADSFTLPVIIVAAAAAGAGLVSVHGAMADMSGPLAGWLPWAALVVMLAILVAGIVHEQVRYRSARRRGIDRLAYLAEQQEKLARPIRTSSIELKNDCTPEVTEATPEHLRLLRYLMSVALQPADDWDSFDSEGLGPLQRYRYQVNALGWALAMYGYSHAPAFRGPLLDAQLALVGRAQDKAVWGYWYGQNLLGNWDFIKRRADPIDVPQNIMFSGYLNLQLGMFRQATGQQHFDGSDSIVFDWSPRQRFEYSHRRINDIVVRNFGQDLCLWPCEPLPFGRGRKRGFVFPYCNAVAAAGVSVMDALEGTTHANDIAPRLETKLQQEFATAGTDLVAFVASGVGLTARRIMSGPVASAGIAALLAPLCPDLSWRTWQILRREWLETGLYRELNSAGNENPDWSTNAKTNAEALASAMLLAQECGETDWHGELWKTAVEQLDFAEDAYHPGVSSFGSASVHSNGMLGLGGFGRTSALTDMASRPRPAEWTNGPVLAEVAHPNVLVAKAVSDGAALDVVLYPGLTGGRFALRVEQLRPGRRYYTHGAVDREVVADALGCAEVAVDLAGRSSIELRPV